MKLCSFPLDRKLDTKYWTEDLLSKICDRLGEKEGHFLFLCFGSFQRTRKSTRTRTFFLCFLGSHIGVDKGDIDELDRRIANHFLWLFSFWIFRLIWLFFQLFHRIDHLNWETMYATINSAIVCGFSSTEMN